MTAHSMSSPPSGPASPVEGGMRKRVCKACDRCRLKKSKCDGATPCSRCKVDNSICVFGERKKSHDKVYPKGYVEMLEGLQAQLVAGLQESYTKLLASGAWPGLPLKETTKGVVLTHEILERLGALEIDGQHGSNNFENIETMRRLIFANEAGIYREPSLDTSSDAENSPQFEHAAPFQASQISDPWVSSRLPPTPPIGSPQPRRAKTSSPLKAEFHLDTTTPYFAAPNTWSAEPHEIIDTGDYETLFTTPLDHEMQGQSPATQQFYFSTGMESVNPTLTMSNDWYMQQDQMQRYFPSHAYT